MNTKLLVDGNGIVCRTWWANQSNVPNRFSKMINEVRPGAEILVCWDAPGGSWRNVIFPRYKAQRPPKPDDLKRTLARCQQERQFKHCRAHGFEADDLIATFARDAGTISPSVRPLVLIMSDDKDMLQLVDKLTLVVNSKRQVLNEQAVKGKFGVAPSELRYLLSWMGDASDGLPGQRGFGPKRSIEKALAHEIGDQLTYDLVELANVPEGMIERW